VGADSRLRSHGYNAMKTYNVLFLCTGNSARSILGEAILNQRGAGRFRAFSAGGHPKGEVHRAALALLDELGLPTAALRSKSWDEFATNDAPRIQFLITVCDDTAGEICPIWPGKPVTVHWGMPDPAAVEVSGQRDAFHRVFCGLDRRISKFLALPHDTMDEEEIGTCLRAIAEAEAVVG
jgi:arsenate reductase